MNSGKLLVAGIVVLIGAGIALFANRPKPEPALAGNPDVNKNASIKLSGHTYEHREKINPGMTTSQVAVLLGEPSEKSESRGDVVSGRWNYLYSDGNLVIKFRDGRVTEIDTTFY
jgi:outer membrane protein assembly factor BamE (lipoprotein component of BamABCDE complex)